jgi:hypothetical protein
MRYTFHGGGPCDGALNGAVMPCPLSSGSAGQPRSAHAFAIRASAPGSVTRTASPSITTSASRIDTATEHRGSRTTLRPFRVPAPVWNQNVPSSHKAPTAVTCGLPSSLTVDSHVVREFRASGAGADPVSSFSTTAAQSTGGSPSALPRLVISISHPFPAAILANSIWSIRRAATARVIAQRGSRAIRARMHRHARALGGGQIGSLGCANRVAGHLADMCRASVVGGHPMCLSPWTSGGSTRLSGCVVTARASRRPRRAWFR